MNVKYFIKLDFESVYMYIVLNNVILLPFKLGSVSTGDSGFLSEPV